MFVTALLGLATLLSTADLVTLYRGGTGAGGCCGATDPCVRVVVNDTAYHCTDLRRSFERSSCCGASDECVIELDGVTNADSACVPPTVLVLGDSWAEFSTQQLEVHCAGATVVNRGVQSSTALEWASSSVACPSGGARSCSASAAFAAAAPLEFTHAWLSVGGNDF